MEVPTVLPSDNPTANPEGVVSSKAGTTAGTSASPSTAAAHVTSTMTQTGGAATTSSTSTSSSNGASSALLTCSFNQDGGCLAVGTTTGFSVHNLYPQYSLSVERELRGGIGRMEMLFRCNLMALVGGGPNPHGAPHRVLIWDDHIPKEIGELSFRQVALNVKLRKDAIVVALRDRIYVYHLADLSLRDKIYTADNPNGLVSVSTTVNDMVVACPSVTTGQVRVELYGLRKTVLIEAHDGALRGLALTSNGSKLATASVKGTVIRVWDVATSSCLQEFRRGVERATITCLCWGGSDGGPTSTTPQWLSCTSDKGTVHIFHVENASISSQNHSRNKNGSSRDKHSNNNSSNTNGNNNHFNGSETKMKKKTSLTNRFFSSVRKSVDGTGGSDGMKKSVCQIRGVPHPLACAFVTDAPSHNVIAVAGWDADGNGVLLISEFAANQEPRRIAYHVLCKSTASSDLSSLLDDGSGTTSTASASNNSANTKNVFGVPMDETDEERRRRRLRGWKPNVPNAPEGRRLLVGERLHSDDSVVENAIQISEEDDFAIVTTKPTLAPPTITTTAATTAETAITTTTEEPAAASATPEQYDGDTDTLSSSPPTTTQTTTTTDTPNQEDENDAAKDSKDKVSNIASGDVTPTPSSKTSCQEAEDGVNLTEQQ